MLRISKPPFNGFLVVDTRNSVLKAGRTAEAGNDEETPRTVAPMVAPNPGNWGPFESLPDTSGNLDDEASANKRRRKPQGSTAFSEVESSEAQLNFFSPPSPSGMAMSCGC